MGRVNPGSETIGEILSEARPPRLLQNSRDGRRSNCLLLALLDDDKITIPVAYSLATQEQQSPFAQ